MSTHTGRAFQAFVYDLLHYTLPRYGLHWAEPPDYLRRSPKVFRPEFGNAVILFRERHANEFRERISVFSFMGEAEDFLSYVERFCQRTFKGNMPLMEFFVFCAFLLDLAIYCLRRDDLEIDLFTEVADETTYVFNKYVLPYFTVVGGWYSLYHVAGQYMSYVLLQARENSAAETLLSAQVV